MNENPKFLLGMGAQKAGTTWLFHYLSLHPQIRQNNVKEYNALPQIFGYIPKKRSFILKYQLYGLMREYSESFETKYYSFLIGKNLKDYLDFFGEILAREKNIFATDMTPGNIALSGNALVQIKNGFAERNITVKAVLLLRDPVERIHSAARMFAQKRGRISLQAELCELDHQLGITFAGYHNRFDRVLSNLGQAFRPQDYYVELYERLFEPNRAAKIVEWLGFSPHLAPAETRVNSTKRRFGMDAEKQALIARKFASSYMAAVDYFGRDEIERHWPSSRFVL